MALDDYELRELVVRRLCEAADDMEMLGGVPDDEPVSDFTGTHEEQWRDLWRSVEAAMWRLAEHENPGRWSPLAPDGLWLAMARKRPGEVEGWGMAWFLSVSARLEATDMGVTSCLTPFRAHVIADSTSVSLDADIGERGSNGDLILYTHREGVRRHSSLTLDADAVRWASSVSALVPRGKHA